MKRAIISVYDKTGLDSLARRLEELKFKILSTGRTSEFLKENGIACEEVSHYTGFPEILGGRVKTLHPKIHAGILARRNETGDLKKLGKLGIGLIDLVVVNLYPFETTPNIENIDIGGPAMLRAAAKNYESVTVVCDPADYDRVASALEGGEVSLELRKKLAGKVFAQMARVETVVAEYFGQRTTNNEQRIKSKSGGSTVHSLRYGENPHQFAVFNVDQESDLLWGKPLQGKELSYNNILDADAAWWLIQEFREEPFACAIIKHTNPCGVATSKKSLKEAFEKSLACDPPSAFGGIVALNRVVDGKTAELISKIFLEIILAPAFSKEALKIFAKKKNLRLLGIKNVNGPEQMVRSAGGGLLLQAVDRSIESISQWEVKTKRKPTKKEIEALQFAWKVAKHTKSNAIVLSSEDQTVGIGGGQMSRIDAVKIAVMKMDINTSTQQHSNTIVCSSDAFFPFPDNIEAIAKAGVAAVIQPGGSIKDAEVITAADQHNLAMVFTGIRHFRH